MNTRPNITETRRLVDRYFAGETTLDEERRLRQLLADPSIDTAEADEARAVMGLFVAERRQQHRPVATTRLTTRRFATAISAAAAIAVVAMLAPRLLTSADSQQQCIAYIGNTTVSDRDAVMSSVALDLHDLAAAGESLTDGVLDDFNDLAGALNNIKNPLQ